MIDKLLPRTTATILAMVIFSSCLFKPQSPAETEFIGTEDQTVAEFTSVTSEFTSTQTSTLEIVETPSFSSTEGTATPPPDIQLTPFPTSAVTPLTAAEHEAILQRLNHEECQLPCYLEITPGETSFLDAQEILSSLGATYFVNSETLLNSEPLKIVRFFLSAIVDEGVVSHGLSVYVQGGLVRRIDISIRSTNPHHLVQGWERFGLINILRQNGVPDRTFVLPGKEGGNSILLNYDSYGTAIAYYGQYRQDTLVCPAFKEEVTTGLDMVLVEPASLQLFAEIEDWPNLFFFQENADTNGIWVSTPTSLGITPGEFYEALLLDEKACFQRSN